MADEQELAPADRVPGPTGAGTAMRRLRCYVGFVVGPVLAPPMITNLPQRSAGAGPGRPEGLRWLGTGPLTSRSPWQARCRGAESSPAASAGGANRAKLPGPIQPAPIREGGKAVI